MVHSIASPMPITTRAARHLPEEPMARLFCCLRPLKQKARMISTAFGRTTISFTSPAGREPGAALLIVPAAAAKGDSPPILTRKFSFLPHTITLRKNGLARNSGPENPDARKITGFDHVEVLDNLRAELVRLLPCQRSPIYTDVPDVVASEILDLRHFH